MKCIPHMFQLLERNSAAIRQADMETHMFGQQKSEEKEITAPGGQQGIVQF